MFYRKSHYLHPPVNGFHQLVLLLRNVSGSLVCASSGFKWGRGDRWLRQMRIKGRGWGAGHPEGSARSENILGLLEKTNNPRRYSKLLLALDRPNDCVSVTLLSLGS